ncbi:DNA-3-methyladenine glycosylase I [Nitratireductor soli]|uniref:DNA-3-methyladenine glycosylase I n=1 Tax=Nitratireductor soli TaxID=1670619 RepID=UPI003CC7A6DF
MSTSAASTALSKDRKKRGWSFVGPTTVHAFMRAMDLINDHGGMCRPATGGSREDDFHTTCIAKRKTERRRSPDITVARYTISTETRRLPHTVNYHINIKWL